MKTFTTFLAKIKILYVLAEITEKIPFGIEDLFFTATFMMADDIKEYKYNIFDIINKHGTMANIDTSCGAQWQEIKSVVQLYKIKKHVVNALC